MKTWEPGCLVCEDDDEYYEPQDRDGRRLAAQVKMTINLAMHRSRMMSANNRAADIPPIHPNYGCVMRPIQPE